MSSREECICSIALTQVPGIGHIWAKKLVDGIGSAADVFRFRQELPERLPGVSNRVVEALDCPQLLVRAGEEYEFAEKNHPGFANVMTPLLLFFSKEMPI